MSSFDSNGNYNKTNWKTGDKITADKLNKIEESLEIINNNDIERYKEVDERLDALEEQKEAVEEELNNKATKDEVEQFERDMTQAFGEFKVDTNAAMTAHKNEVSEVVDGFSGEIESINTQLAYNEIHSSGYINVKEFGATGDGVTDDYPAIQEAINYAYTSGVYKIIIPAGWYYLSTTLKTRTDSSWDTNGIIIEGCGFNTILSRSKKTELPNLSNSSCDYTDSEIVNGAVLAIHSCKNIITNIKFVYSRVGIYIGQNNEALSVKANTLFNRFTNIFIQNCEIGIASRAGGGSYYNNFKNVQVAQGNLGIDIRKSYDGYTDVFNRNNFADCEVNKVYCGVALWNGDTNTFNGVHFEGIGMGNGSKPTWLPDGKSVAIYPTYQLNTFAFCMCEGNELDVYDDAYGTNYINNHFDIYNGKFKKGSRSNLGTFIGSGTGGVSNYFKTTGILMQPTKALDSDAEVNSIVFTAEATDAGYGLKSYNIWDNMTPRPVNVYTDSIYKHKKVCGINYIWLKTAVVVSEENKNAAINLLLPRNPNNELSSYVYRQGLRVPIIVGTESVLARFASPNKLVIPAPSSGWNTRDEDGYYTWIDIQTVYY